MIIISAARLLQLRVVASASAAAAAACGFDAFGATLLLIDRSASRTAGNTHLDLSGGKFNLLRVHLWHILGHRDGRFIVDETLGEHDVDLFETPAGGFGVEEVDDGYKRKVEDGKYHVRLPADRGYHGGRDLDNKEVLEIVVLVGEERGGDCEGGTYKDPVGACTDGVCSRAGRKRRQLGGVQPRELEPGGAKEDHIQEQAKSGAL